jgi:hypothetical protein
MKEQKYIVIKADTNDADCITEMSVISDEDLAIIQPVIDLLKSKRKERRHNWEIGECERDGTIHERYVETGLLTEEQVDVFDEYVPHGEYGIHTIESIRLLVVSEEKTLF